jgi:hypothetical protein
MTLPKNAVYSIPALLIATIVVISSLAITSPTTTSVATQVVVQPPIDVGPLGESIAVTGIPIVFSENTKPTTNAVAAGLLETSKQRAAANFIADVGRTVEVTLTIDNKSDDNELLTLVNIIAPDALIIDVIEGTGTDEVRLIGENMFIMEVNRGDGNNFKVRVTPLESGFYSLFVELRAIG